MFVTKNNNWIKIGFSLIVIVGILGLFAASLPINEEVDRELLVIKPQYLGGLHLEYGIAIDLDPATYLDFDKLSKSQESIIASEARLQLKTNTLDGVVDLNPTTSGKISNGDYALTLSYLDEIKVIDISVADTKAPIITGITKIDVFKGEPLEEDTIANLLQIDDLSPVATKYNFDDINFDKVGSYTLDVTACDANNNCASHAITINVLERPVVESEAANYSFSNQTSQIIDVKVSGNTGTLSLHNKENGVWTEIFSVFCFIGGNGLSYDRTEGDMTTPGGYYRVGLAFGIAEDPGCIQGYHQVTPYDYWLGSNDKYYNQLVDVRNGEYDLSGSEHLIDYKSAYAYSLDIGYNPDGVIGKGSAIFLHCSTGGNTAGCVSIAEDYMARLLRNLRSDTIIYIH